MKLKNKILITFLIIISLFLLQKNNSYATVNFTVGEHTYKFKEETSAGFDTSTYNYLIYSNYYGEDKVQFKIVYWYKEDYLKLAYYGTNNEYARFNIERKTSRTKDLFMDYTVGTTTIGTTNELSFTQKPSFYDTSSDIYCDYMNIFLADIVTTTQDLYLDDNLVFQKPVVGQIGFLALEQIYPTQIQETTKETLVTIIPIAILVFSALLSPFLIKLVIYHHL